MNGRMITFAVAALMTGGSTIPLEAPPPTPEAAEWLAARMPTPVRPALMVNYAELQCLALNVYWEARGESAAGQAGVAHVTLNRVGAPGFPGTICGVVRQGGRAGTCQFGWNCDRKSDEPTDARAWARAQSVALRTLAGGPDPTGGALYFHHLREQPHWAAGRYLHKVRIGEHVFFRLHEPGIRLALGGPENGEGR